jgi:hypothetical protein
MTAIWLFLRAESRRRWRAWLSLALIVGVFAGGVVTAAAGARRTGSAYARFLDWSRAPDALVDAEPYNPSFARLSPAAVMRVPQAADAAVIKSFGVTPGIVQLIAPASNAIPGGFWKRKILSGRLADPARPGEVNVSFTLAQRFHLRPGDPLRLVLTTVAGRPAAFVFHVAGIDAAHAEFPPQPGNGTYIAWGTPAFYRQHRALDGFVQVALRFYRGSRDWPTVNRELGRHTNSKLVEATLLSTQSVNTQRSIRPQAVALWLLAALLGVIGLLIVGQLLARLSFLEAAGYGTLRALGMSRGQLMTACQVRAAAIGAAGGLIAGVLGVALSPLLPVGLAGVAELHPGMFLSWPSAWPPRSWSPRAARRGQGGGPRLSGRWPGGPSPATGRGAAGSSPAWRPPGRSRWLWASGWLCTAVRAERRCRCAARSPARAWVWPRSAPRSCSQAASATCSHRPFCTA